MIDVYFLPREMSVYYGTLLFNLSAASDARSRTSVGRTARLERVRAVNFSGFRRQQWIEQFVTSRLRKVEGSITRKSVGIKFAGVKTKTVRQSLHLKTTDVNGRAVP